MSCKICNTDNQTIKFIKAGKWMGSTRPNNPELFRSEEFTLGWDYYPRYNLRQFNCECGYVWYEKVEER